MIRFGTRTRVTRINLFSRPILWLNSRVADVAVSRKSLVLLGLCASMGMAQGGTPTAVLYGQGRVLVNGRPQATTTLLDGDIVDSGDGAATIVLEGSSLLLAKQTRVEYHASFDKLLCGTVRVVTNSGRTVKVGGALAYPAEPKPTEYIVEMGKSRQPQLNVVRGTLLVQGADGSRAQVLQGKAVSLEVAGGCQPQT